jgi:hypothetical protein
MNYEEDLISTHLRRLWSRYSQRFFLSSSRSYPPAIKPLVETSNPKSSDKITFRNFRIRNLNDPLNM